MTAPPVELRLWRQFAAVAEELHFGRAARSLHMTQPPLTQAIAQLERLLEVRLFERTKRSVSLTPAGSALLPQVHELLARARAPPAQARAGARGGPRGRARPPAASSAGCASPSSPPWASRCCRNGCAPSAPGIRRCRWN